MYYPLYNNPFYYPPRAYIPNMCSYNYVYENRNNSQNPSEIKEFSNSSSKERNFISESQEDTSSINNGNKNNFFSITDDRLEMFGISINIDDLIILVTLFFMFRENQIDYSIIIILALILFDQN